MTGLPNYKGIPLVNTVVLLRRGVTLSISYNQFLFGIKSDNTIAVTLVLALIFLIFQYYEYTIMRVSMRDGVFGRIFYFSTGFHIIHVFFGSLFLLYN
jgi:cytochrome c oxidase subunit 3